MNPSTSRPSYGGKFADKILLCNLSNNHGFLSYLDIKSLKISILVRFGQI